MREATAEIASFLGWLGIRKSSRRRDAVTSTRDACATRWIRSIVFHLHFHVSRLKDESQHLDRGRDFDVLVANNEIERSVARLIRTCRLGARRICLGGLFARRTFILFIVHVQSADDKKLSTRAHDLIQDFSRRSRRCFKCKLHNVALQQFRGSRARLGRLCATGRATLLSGSSRRRWSRENSAVLRQRCAVKRSHAVHFGVQQDIYEHLYLGELLSEQRRHGCFRQSGGKFIETELKFVWEFHVVRMRSVYGGDHRLA